MHAARVLRQRHKQAAEAGALQEDGSLCAEQRRALEEAFEAADKNGDGVLSAEEYHEIFAAHGLSIGERTLLDISCCPQVYHGSKRRRVQKQKAVGMISPNLGSWLTL